MTVRMIMVSEKRCGVLRQETYMAQFQKLFPISMRQFLEELSTYVKIWEPEELKISTQINNDAEEAEEVVFRKSYKGWPIYVLL